MTQRFFFYYTGYSWSAIYKEVKNKNELEAHISHNMSFYCSQLVKKIIEKKTAMIFSIKHHCDIKIFHCHKLMLAFKS